MTIINLKNWNTPDFEFHRWYVRVIIDQRWALSLNVYRFNNTKSDQCGFSVAWILSDSLSSAIWRRSSLDFSFLENCREIASRNFKDDVYIDSFLESTINKKVFAPFTLIDTRVTHTHGLGIEMGGCRISIEDDLSQISLELKDYKFEILVNAVSITDRPFDSQLNLSDSVSINFVENLWYKCDVSISIDSRTHRLTSSELWIDWQDVSRFFTSKKSQSMFYNWSLFSIRLTDHSAMKIGHTGLDNGEVSGIINQIDGSSSKTASLQITENQTYESLRTYNKYPCNWSISSLDKSIELEITPSIKDQEVYTFSLQRGVMQYHCRVKGRFNGLDIDNNANVEVTGCQLNLNEFFWSHDKTNLANQIKSFIPDQVSESWLKRMCPSREEINLDLEALQLSVIEPIWSMMNRGGKGWRSTWFTMCCYALGENLDDSQIRALLPITELIHTGSLIIDDIQDNSALRRGKPALHKEIGTDLAINVGNFCYFLPLIVVDEIKDLDDGQRYRILSIIMESLRLGHLGQAVDLMWSNNKMDMQVKLQNIDQTISQLVEQYRCKSGCQLNAIARIAGVLYRSSTNMVKSIAEYSYSFGVIFQIIDDVIDVIDGTRKLGKEQHEDLRNLKLNYVILRAFKALETKDRNRWADKIQSASGSDRVKKLLDLIDSTDAVDAALQDAYEMYNNSLCLLDQLPATDARMLMKSVPLWLLNQQQTKRKSSSSKFVRK